MNFEDLKVIWDSQADAPMYAVNEEGLHALLRQHTAHFTRRMRYRHLGITAADWGVFRGVLKETLEALRIADTERHEVVDFVETLKADIVQG